MCAPDLGWTVQLLTCSLTEVDVVRVTVTLPLKPGVDWWLLISYMEPFSTLLSTLSDSLRLHLVLHEWLAFYSAFFLISTEVVYLKLKRWHGWCHMKVLVFLIVLYVSSYRWVYFSRAVLSSQWWYDDESDMLCCWTRLQFLWPCLD